MTALSTTEARSSFGKLLNRVARRKERVALTRRGKIVAALVSPDDYALLQQLRDAEEAEDVKAAKAALAEYERTGISYPLEQVKKELGL